MAGAAALTVSMAAASAAQAATPRQSSPRLSSAELTHVFAAARRIPASAVRGIAAGTLHTGSYRGTTWAIASFAPRTSDSAILRTAFQDGGSAAVFRESAAGGWRLVDIGLRGCGTGLPASLARQWGIARPASVCSRSQVAKNAQVAKHAAQVARRNAALHASASGSTVGQTIASIALSQVGVLDTPASETFALDCNPYSTMVAGFSANADGCGLNTAFNVEDMNETWCADFAKWVWQQAGVTADMSTLNAGALSFYDWGQQQGDTMTSDPTDLAVGDAIMFYPSWAANAGVYSDHVGLVVGVNSDGTVNLVNGDFGGANDPIKVEYDPDVSLASWASAVWSPGEEWTVVAPPTGTQQPTPKVAIIGPKTVVAGTSVNFSALGVQQGGSVTTYDWMFGDGRNTNVTGQSVSHEWAEDGIYPVTVTAVSSLGTVTTKVQDVDVTGGSSAVASATNNSIWFDPGPINQYVFQQTPTGGLVADYTDGGTWLQLPVPGNPDSGSGLTSLGYPDPNNADAMTPHAYYSEGGTLTETYQASTGWTSQTLAGAPEAGSAIVASAESAGPDVFYFGAGGVLSETTDSDGTWTTSAVGGPATGRPGSLALTDTATGPELFYLDQAHELIAEASIAGHWVSAPVVSRFGVAQGSPLSAVATGPEQADLFFIDGSGHLAEAKMLSIVGLVSELPGTPAASGGLASTSYLVGSSQSTVGGPTTLGQDVYYLDSSGQPQVDYTTSTGGQWQTAFLPGTGTSVAGADSFQFPGQPSSLYLTTSGQLSLDQASSPSGSWSPVTLPAAPSTWANQIVLYAATPADEATALSIAAQAGLPASDVTTSFYDAWIDTENYNEYLVITVGDAATIALYYNVCGWANPTDGGYTAGSTPFSIQYPPLDGVPGVANADNFETGDAANSSQTVALATDLVDYAATGSYPAGVTLSNLPEFNWSPPYVCEGSPN
ncbi:MAG TPA: PKD domain-containing protein [Streptosporangiaceae bacterium]|nr:PKD domain-containing protein [Streptosporangiaceae bacterium]